MFDRIYALPVLGVVVELSYTYGGLAGGKMGADTVMQREMNEKWIRADGEWWLLPTR